MLAASAAAWWSPCGACAMRAAPALSAALIWRICAPKLLFWASAALIAAIMSLVVALALPFAPSVAK
ncbi:hypothetical protein ABTD62_19350, partial [Acinetobacter baumannii]